MLILPQGCWGAAMKGTEKSSEKIHHAVINRVEWGMLSLIPDGLLSRETFVLKCAQQVLDDARTFQKQIYAAERILESIRKLSFKSRQAGYSDLLKIDGIAETFSNFACLYTKAVDELKLNLAEANTGHPLFFRRNGRSGPDLAHTLNEARHARESISYLIFEEVVPAVGGTGLFDKDPWETVGLASADIKTEAERSKMKDLIESAMEAVAPPRWFKMMQRVAQNYG